MIQIIDKKIFSDIYNMQGIEGNLVTEGRESERLIKMFTSFSSLGKESDSHVWTIIASPIK